LTPEGSRPLDNLGANQGFRALAFRGVPVVADKKCTSARIYTLNEKHLFFYNMPAAPQMGYSMKNGFIWTGFRQPVNQDAVTGALLWYGQMVCDSPRTQAVRTGVSS
jgi:hypothetical protein